MPRMEMPSIVVLRWLLVQQVTSSSAVQRGPVTRAFANLRANSSSHSCRRRQDRRFCTGHRILVHSCTKAAGCCLVDFCSAERRV